MFAALLALAAVIATDPLVVADTRVAAAAWRLQTGAVGLCEKTTRVSGVAVQLLDAFPPHERADAARRYGLGRFPTVELVVPGSSAARAGLKTGDAIALVDGQPVALATEGAATYATSARFEEQLEAGLRAAPVELTLADGRRLGVDGDPACASRVQLLPNKGLNASADGTYVQLGGKLYDFAESDDELAAAIAHELAHNFLGHRSRLNAAKVSRGLFGGLGRNGRALRATEDEADWLSVWLVARAGYRTDAIVPFLTRLSRRAGASLDGTHPSWPDRLERIAAAVAEVERQRRAGLPLVPPSQP